MAQTAEMKAAKTDLKKALRTYPEAYLECRDFAHAWELELDFHVEPGQSVGRKVQYLRRTFLCRRCPKQRVQRFFVGRYGLEKIADYHNGPADYKLPGLPPGVSLKDVVRQESYRRSMERAVGAEPGQRATAER